MNKRKLEEIQKSQLQQQKQQKKEEEEEKKKKENQNITTTKKIIISKTITSAPIKYNSKSTINKSTDTYEKTLQGPIITLYEKVSTPTATSYQQALKAIDPHFQPKYVFPQYAPSKPSSEINISNSSNVVETLSSLPNSIAKKFYRTAAGETWEDPTLAEWNPNDFRIFVGDLGNEVTDNMLANAFKQYPSFQKARVIRDKKSAKSKGYGFVSFSDPQDFTRALKEVNGKYIGNRPCKLKKSTWKDRLDEEKIQRYIQHVTKTKNKKKK